MPDKHRILSGPMVCSLMRKHRLTIDALAQKFHITKKRIREVREHGVTGFHAEEWIFLITGAWPDRSAS